MTETENLCNIYRAPALDHRDPNTKSGEDKKKGFILKNCKIFIYFAYNTHEIELTALVLFFAPEHDAIVAR